MRRATFDSTRDSSGSVRSIGSSSKFQKTSKQTVTGLSTKTSAQFLSMTTSGLWPSPKYLSKITEKFCFKYFKTNLVILIGEN